MAADPKKQTKPQAVETGVRVPFVCTCGKRSVVNSENVGKKVRCSHCGRVVVVDPHATYAAPAHAAESMAAGHPGAPTLDDASKSPGSYQDILSPPQGKDEIGRLGAYRVLQVLGAGGMGVVFKAEDTGLARLVAVKAMLSTVAKKTSARERFLREARAAAALKHDHVVGIFQVGEDRGIPYFAMEFLEGESLDDCLKRDGPLPLEEVLRIGREIADGLGAAHDRDMIHRDIKPGNVWLEKRSVRRKDGAADATTKATARVKILDFGLARGVDDASITRAGAVMGTPAYMPIEQAKGERVDARCDVYSLGVVLYQMATGKLPFEGENALAVLAALLSQTPVEPRLHEASIPASLNDLIMRLLSKNADERPGNASEVYAALCKIEESIGISSTPTFVSQKTTSQQTLPPTSQQTKKSTVSPGGTSTIDRKATASASGVRTPKQPSVVEKPPVERPTRPATVPPIDPPIGAGTATMPPPLPEQQVGRSRGGVALIAAIACGLTAAVAGLAFWLMRPATVPPVTTPFTHGILEVGPTGMRAVAIRFDPKTRTEANEAKPARFVADSKKTLSFDAGSRDYTAASVAEVVAVAKKLMALAEKPDAGKNAPNEEEILRTDGNLGRKPAIAWQVVLVSGVQAKGRKELDAATKGKAKEKELDDSMAAALARASKEIGTQLECEVSATTVEEDAKTMYQTIVPADMQKAGTALAVAVEPTHVMAVVYVPANNNFAARYIWTFDVPGPCSEAIAVDAVKFDLNGLGGRLSYAKAVGAVVDKKIEEPLDRGNNQDDGFVNFPNIYIVGSAVRAFCRIARPDISPSADTAQLRFKKDGKAFHDRLVQEGAAVYGTAPADALSSEDKTRFETELAEFRTQLPLPQLFSAAATLSAVESGLQFRKRNVVFRSGPFDRAVTYLLNRLNRTDRVAFETGRRHFDLRRSAALCAERVGPQGSVASRQAIELRCPALDSYVRSV
jgi:serine/threonine protein kinase